MANPEPDVIVDILQRVRDSADLPDTIAQKIERDARLYWGGERPYIAKAGESPRRREASERAERIRADHRRGERVPLLARRYEMSQRHVRRILGMPDTVEEAIAEAIAQPPANDPTRRRPLPTRKSRRRKSGPDA